MSSQWKLAAGSAVGVEHARCGRESQDAFATDVWRREKRTVMDDPLVVAVADGASSRRLGAIGAAAAARIAVEAGTDSGCLGDPTSGEGMHAVLVQALHQTLEKFTKFASSATPSVLEDGSPDDFGTTLCVAVVSLPWVGAVSIGDGFVVTERFGAQLDLLVAPDPCSDTPGATTFLTSAHANDNAQIRVAWIPDLTAIALSTDGLATLALEFDGSRPRGVFPGFLSSILQQLRNDPGSPHRLTAVLAGERISSHSADDKTLVVAVRA